MLEEYGMMSAFTSSMTSSSLSRQVGASIFTNGGDLISTGINEVPKAGGGHYVAGDENDAREWKQGYDSNTRRKARALEEFVSNFEQEGWLSERISKSDIIKKSLESGRMKNSAFFNLIEYGREVHAEMSALMSAVRVGISVEKCTMYCTTFPCHICAKHIIASGISKVVYIEPYPKSLAKDLYGDSITGDEMRVRDRIQFEPFVGVSPIQYMKLFRMARRKDADGNTRHWNPEESVLRYSEPGLSDTKEKHEMNRLSEIMLKHGMNIEKS